MRRRISNRSDEGFTLVELLVVVLIIAILAAVAIPAYLAQQDQSKDAAVKAALHTVQTKLGQNDIEDATSEDERVSIWQQSVSDAGYKYDQSSTVLAGDITIGHYDFSSNSSYTMSGCLQTVSGGGSQYTYGGHCWKIDQSGQITKVEGH